MADDLSKRLAGVLQVWSQQPDGPQTGTSNAVALAEQTGDVRAEAVATWALGNTGDWARAAEFAEKAAAKGSIGIATWAANNLQGQGDQSLRRAALRLHSLVADAGPGVDFVTIAHQLVSVGDLDGAADAIEELVVARPHNVRTQWDTLIAEVQPRLKEIGDAAVAAATERDRVMKDMDEQQREVAGQREAVERLVSEVGGLANKAGGLVLANDYGERANTIEARANWATVISIVLAVLIAILAIVLAVDAWKDVEPLRSALQKAPITVPFLLLNIYIARLAHGFREEAIKLRHIELQIRTANPFLGALDPERRQAVLAMLALRFFPGQEVAGSGKSPSEPTDPGQAFAALLTPPGSTGQMRQMPPSQDLGAEVGPST